jgi:hypothetical protein
MFLPMLTRTQQVFYLKETSKVPPSGLDLNLADQAEFAPNK